jgi:hypothetical protein
MGLNCWSAPIIQVGAILKAGEPICSPDTLTHCVAGLLSHAGAQAVFRWISLNMDALVAYWEGQIDTAEVCQMLKPLPVQQTMP